MNNVKKDYNELIKRTFDTLYTMFGGMKKTHSELLTNADYILKILTTNYGDSIVDDYDEIKKCIVELYEIEVGSKTYAPNIIAKDKQSKYWLYKIKPEIPHSYFDRYKLYLSNEGFSRKTIDNIEQTCESVLAYCANPQGNIQESKKRGLVVGDVQSGKTANYLGLINMAYDYGYKIVVLLAGTTDSLRIQTQKRTDKGVIGAKSDSIGNVIEYIGVGSLPHEHYAVPFTNQSNDFAKFIQNNLNANISDFNKPVVLVVKKNRKILESVTERLQSELSEQGLDSKSILIIDDEADNASINVSKNKEKPSTINRCIKQIFNKFPIASYVGYTATPFANLFISPYDENENDYDLFPSDFIVQLNAPDSYFGGRKVFPGGEELPRCIRKISETEDGFLEVVHDKYVSYPKLAGSLKEAIHSFLINNVIRNIRGDVNKHRSMMINITRFNDVQLLIWERVSAYIEKLTNEIEQLSSYSVDEFIKNDDMRAIHSLYTSDDFYKKFTVEESDEGIVIPWKQIQDGLYEEIRKIQIVTINSRNGRINRIEDGKKKRFDYEEYESEGARVIAIGGMVLSRGLTLEGLMTSYYSRNAGTYDSLLQMCRWFGYRPNYEDLCRVYLTQTNIDRFNAVLDAIEDLKLQFSEMERQNKTPKQFGLMVRESPDTLETSLLVTARNKLSGSESIEIRLNYGGVYADTSKLSKDARINQQNYEAFVNLMKHYEFKYLNDRYMAQGVSKFDVAALIRNIRIPWINKKFDTDGLSEYIENSHIFQYWDVVVASGDSTDIINCFGITGVNAVKRRFTIRKGEDYIRVGGNNNRVLEPSIFNAGLWLSGEEKKRIIKEKNEKTPRNPPYTEMTATDYLKIRENPILVIYPIDLVLKNDNEDERIAKESLGEGIPLIAFAVGFPAKESEEKFVYRANRVKLDELTANLEFNDEEEGEDDED